MKSKRRGFKNNILEVKIREALSLGFSSQELSKQIFEPCNYKGFYDYSSGRRLPKKVEAYHFYILMNINRWT